MFKTHRSAKLGAVCVGALALAVGFASMAQADPVRTDVAVGSDTIQDVDNALSNGASPAIPDFASYNAFGTDQIIVDSSNTAFARPSGSGPGVFALSASLNPAGAHVPVSNTSPTPTVDIAGKVDVARSSSAPTVGGTVLTYIPAFRDAVAVAVVSPIGQLTNLTTAEETALYTCSNSGRIQVSGTTIRFNDGAGHTQTLHPILPQTGSGTRNFFQAAIGVPNGSLGSCVTLPNLPENNGTVLVNNGVGTVQPFSAAQYIGQNNGFIFPNTTAGVTLINTNTLTPTAGSGTSLTPGTLYGSLSTVPTPGVGVFSRDTYHVIATAKVGTALETKVTTDIDTPAAHTIIGNFGFGVLAYVGNHADYLTSGYTN